MTSAKFNRILLKLSGEALAGEKGHGIDSEILTSMASEIASVVKSGVPCVVMSAVRMEPICEFFDRRRAISLLSAGTVVIFSAGTGNPYFTTDSAAALRASETDCDVIMKATKVDGIYTDDPVKNPSATRFDDISYEEVIRRGLKVMDTAAVAICLERKMPILVFKMAKGNLTKATVEGSLGTLVHC